MGWLYRHATLAPLSISTHVWFLGNSAMLTVLAPFVLRRLGVRGLAGGAVSGSFGDQVAFFMSAAAFLIAVATPVRSARIETTGEDARQPGGTA